MYLIDTSVISEIGKQRPDETVRAWFDWADADNLWLSVLVIGEIEAGIANRARRDPRSAGRLTAWLDRLVVAHRARILPSTRSETGSP